MTTTFKISIVPETPADIPSPEYNPNSRIETAGRQSLGGRIIMGQSGSSEFKGKDGMVYPAISIGSLIKLNPDFYDPKAPNKEYLSDYNNGNETLGGAIVHEIGHDLGLTHEEDIYPSVGTMSNGGNHNPTLDEMSTITSPNNGRVIQPGQRVD